MAFSFFFLVLANVCWIRMYVLPPHCTYACSLCFMWKKTEFLSGYVIKVGLNRTLYRHIKLCTDICACKKKIFRCETK